MNTRRPSCGSARRRNSPLSVIVLIQRSAVVAGTAAAVHKEETGTRCCAISAARYKMLTITDGGSLARALKAPIDQRLKRLLLELEVADELTLELGRNAEHVEAVAALARQIGLLRAEIDSLRHTGLMPLQETFPKWAS